jgi:hypothetical protein
MMTLNIAYFADLGAGLTSYPTDGHMQQVFNDMLSQAKNKVQIAVQRDGNLLHYGYMRQVGAGKFFGICVSMPGVVCNMARWFHHFDHAYSSLVIKGAVVHFYSNGELKIANNSLPSEKQQLELLTDALLAGIHSDKSLKYAPLPTASIAVSRQTVAKHSLEEGSETIQRSLEKYYNIYITRANADIELLTSYSHTLRNQSNKIAELEKQVASLNIKKKQYSLVVTLSLVLLLGAVIAIASISGKNREISEKNSNIQYLDSIVGNQNLIIGQQVDQITSLNRTLNAITSYSYMVGASPRAEGSSRDNGWIMWLRARQSVKINYFYIESSNSGYITLSLYSENSDLVASQEFYISSSHTWTKIRPDDFKMVEPGYYYMRISDANGLSLRYHASSDGEFSRYRVGALQITGCCSYSDRENSEKKTYSSYYQYFYNINYSIL